MSPQYFADQTMLHNNYKSSDGESFKMKQALG